MCSSQGIEYLRHAKYSDERGKCMIECNTPSGKELFRGDSLLTTYLQYCPDRLLTALEHECQIVVYRPAIAQ